MIILLSGQRGSGKTTTFLRLARSLRQAGVSAGGVICPGVFTENRKTGIRCRFMASGQEELLGKDQFVTGRPEPEASDPDSLRYGRWEFSQSILAQADTAVIRDIGTLALVFVDEIGPLELDHGMGMVRTLDRLDADTLRDKGIFLVCTRQELSRQLQARWPDSILVELSEGGQSGIDSTVETLAGLVKSRRALTPGT